jgi:AcrR family transcriptional regulator
MVNSIHQMDAERQRARPSTTRRARPVAPVDRFSAHAGAPRRPGARALQTRSRLLDATVGLLDELPYRELTSAVVTQRLGLSAPAFYRYFADINDALAECASTMRDNVRAIADLVAAHSWREGSVESARQVIDAFATFWQRHRALYRVIDLLADEGDPRFVEIKLHTFESLTDAFAEVMADVEGRDARAAAGVVVASLVHVTARESGFVSSGITVDALRQSLAEQVALMVTGSRPKAQTRSPT